MGLGGEEERESPVLWDPFGRDGDETLVLGHEPRIGFGPSAQVGALGLCTGAVGCGTCPTCLFARPSGLQFRAVGLSVRLSSLVECDDSSCDRAAQRERNDS